MIRFLCCVLLIFLNVNCKRAKEANSELPTDLSGANQVPEGELFLVAEDLLSCKGVFDWPSSLFDRLIHNEDLSEDHWQMQKIALSESLSAIPPELAIQVLAHGGEIRVAKSPHKNCNLSEFSEESDLAYCTVERDDGYTIFLSGYENNSPSIKPANTDVVYAFMESYVHTVMTNDLNSQEFLPEAYDVSLFANEKIEQLYERFVNERNLSLPKETQEDIFVLLSFMSLCSETTRTDLETLLPGALDEVFEVISVTFEDDAQDGKKMTDLAMELGVVWSEGNLELTGIGSFAQHLMSSFRRLPSKVSKTASRISDTAGSLRKRIDGGKTSTYKADSRAYKEGIQKFKDDINASNLTPLQKQQALKELEDLNKLGTKFSRGLEASGFYKSGLAEIKQKPWFHALYEAKGPSRHGCFLQVPKEFDGKTYGFTKEVSKDTENITITIPGTFEGQATKVGGTWFDPHGQTAKAYANLFNGRPKTSPLGQNDFLATFRWKGENTKASRNEAAEDLADNLIDLVGKRNGDFSKPLKIDLIGHSHGGNVGYLALQKIARRADQGDEAALRFVKLVKENKIDLKMLAIATPRRADYMPPAWAKVMHVSVKGDGVAYLGKVDGVNQLKRFFASSNMDRKKAWDKVAQENENFRRVKADSYGMDKAFLENHTLAPQSFLHYLDLIYFMNRKDKNPINSLFSAN